MKKILTLIVLAAVVVVGYLLFRGGDEAMAPSQETTPSAEGNIITYANSAFSPKSVKVAVGQSVTFVNNHSAAIRVASKPHPIHTSYPKLESGTIAPGASYVFTATEKVTIQYHNHFNPAVDGEIIVE